MGWSVSLESNKDITYDEIDHIAMSLPTEYWLGGCIPPSQQIWGWNACVDISKPTGNTVTISGSYSISGDMIEPFSDYLKGELEKLGHSINVGECW